MNNLEIKAMIKEDFKDHKATIVTATDDVTVMDWKREGSRIYSIRYIATQNHLCITGDVGSGVFDLTWKPKFTDDWKLEMMYFSEKMRASDSGKFSWDADDAQKDFEEYIEERIEVDEPLNKKTIKEIQDAINEGKKYHGGMDGYTTFSTYIFEQTDIHSDDYDLYTCFGKRTPIRHWYWLIGLQMASKYLKDNAAKNNKNNKI